MGFSCERSQILMLSQKNGEKNYWNHGFSSFQGKQKIDS